MTTSTPNPAADATAEKAADSKPISISPEDVDAEGFISIWNIACSSCNNDTAATRELAARLLIFLCKKECKLVVTSSTNAEYLDGWFERDKKILHDWKPESEFVDIVAQHAEVPADAILLFLDNEGFNMTSKYTQHALNAKPGFRKCGALGRDVMRLLES